MGKEIINVSKRRDLGKNGSRRVRKEGGVPAIIYSVDVEDPIPITVERRVIDRILHKKGGKNHILTLKVDNLDEYNVIIKDFQLDPIKDTLVHVDFLTVKDDRPVKIKVGLETEGIPVGVKNYGGMLVKLLREIPVECLPGDIPEEIKIDVSSLGINDVKKIKDIDTQNKFKILMNSDVVIAIVKPTRATVAKETAKTETE